MLTGTDVLSAGWNIFGAQFNCRASINTVSNVAAETKWSTTLEPPTDKEIAIIIQELKRGKATGPDELPPALFKDGEVAFVQMPTRFI